MALLTLVENARGELGDSLTRRAGKGVRGPKVLQEDAFAPTKAE